MKLLLTIENIQDATGSIQATRTFTARGGLIGSGDGADWKVQDLGRTIPETALQVSVTDGAFTIAPSGDADVFVNDARAAIGRNDRVRLRNRDSILVGGLKFIVNLPNEALESFREDGFTSLDMLIDGKAEEDDSLLAAPDARKGGSFSVFEREQQAEDVPDPLAGVSRAAPSFRDVDPVAGLGGFEDPDEDGVPLREGQSIMRELEMTQHQPLESAQPDYTAQTSASVQLHALATAPSRTGTRPMYTTKAYDFEDDETPEGGSVDHVALRPLAHALGLPIGEISQEDAHRILGEIGAALRAVAEEINGLYADRQGRAHRFPLATMHMHAIEDNPLRFKTSADAALRALLLDHGPVYLNAPAAFRETLQHLNHHQDATEQAVDQGLDALMKALSPEALERRFRNYARRTPTPEERDAWCWRMYRHYFDELRSKNQRGLQLLFREVFGHEYQNTMRRMEWDRAEDFPADVEEVQP